MAVTKAQMAQWSRNYEGKYKDKKNEDSYHPAQTEPATKEQMNRWEENYQKKQNEANRVSNRMAQSRSGSGVRTAVESPLQTRVQLPQGSTDTRWMSGGTRQLGTLDSKKLADEVLDSVLGTATGSPVKTDRQEDYEPDWNYAGGDNTPQQRAQAANAVKRDDFDRWNLWMDADTRHRELVDLMRQKEQDYTSYAQQGTSARAPTAGAGGGAYTSYAQSGTSRSAGGEKETKAKYTDAQLRGMGYSQQEIDKARQYLTEYPAYNPAAVFVRRGADTAKGIAATVAAAVPMTGENLGVSIWNEMETRKNWKALREEVRGNTRQEKLLGMLTGGKTTYAQQGSTATSMQSYTDAELLEKGYTQAEIDTMRSRIAGTKVADSVDKDTLGYKLYDYGKRHTAAAQAGMTPAARTAMGVVSSAAENLAVAGVSPYLVLPVLSAQGAAESMGESVEKGQSAGRTLATGLAKFGAGWAINSVGAADLARSMGADYAKDTLAGQIADWVRGLGGDSAFAKAYPAVANALTGGVDNAVQAFVETYADTAIDAVLGGDTEAAEALLKPETFVTALQSGLTGGASGALGGAVGTGLGAMSAQVDYKAQQVQAQQQAAQLAQEYRAIEKRALEPGESAAQAQRTAEQKVDAVQAAQQVQREETPSPLQSGDAGAATELPLGGSLSQRKDAAQVSDNAAVQQFEQMAQAQQLTGKTIRMFTPEAGNEANRAAFEAAYGVQLPDTAAATRRMLREVAAQRVQSEETAAQTAQQQAAEEALGEQSPLTVPASQTAAQERSSPKGESLSQRNVEKAGESVETVQPVQAGEADTTQSGALRETYGLRQQSLTEKQRSVQRELSRWKVSRGASETISRMVPDSITDLDRYTSAASCMYRLGQMEGVKTFDKALELAGSTSGLAGFTNYVLQQPGGKEALQAAWTQGQGETEAAGGLGGALSSQSTSGEGRVIWKGSLRTADEMATQLIQLNAESTGTDAVLKSVLRGPDGTPSKRVKAYIDTETGRIFFADGNENVFATILHEDFHWYNALDAEGAKALMDMALEYMAESEGYENVDRMIREKMQDYAAQNLTYEQAAEELVADSWSGIFETVEDMTRWAQFQRAQADKNAGKAGTITKAVNAVKELLNSIISKAKEILNKDPENRAALHAKNLAQAQKKALQDAYFAHAEKAMDNLRAAKENAAAIEGNGAAQGVRYSLPEMAKETETEKTKRQMALAIRPAEQNAERTAKVSGQEWSGLRPQDALKAIKPVLTEFGIQTKEFQLKELDVNFSYGNNNIHESVSKQTELTPREYNDLALVQANIEEVLANAVPLEAHTDKKGKPHVDGMIVLASALQDGERIIPVRAELKLYDNRPTALYFAIAETTAKESRNAANKKEPGLQVRQESLLAQEAALTGSIEGTGSEDGGNASVEVRPTGSSEVNILDYYRLVNHDANFTKYFSDEVAQKAEGLEVLRDEQQQVDKQRRKLKEERSAWLESDAVKEIEAKKKALGVFSAEAKSYRDSAEYQSYLSKRKDYNSRLAQLEERSTALDDRMREAGERMRARANAKANDRQLTYNAEAEKHGGKAEYRRVLAKEQFGVTEDFKKAGYILPDGQMLDFAQNDRSRDTDHREIMNVFGPAEVKTGTEALNEFLLDGNVRVMAEAPGIDLSADTAPTAQQLEQIRKMTEQLGSERGQFTLDISTADGKVAASKEYSGRVDADKVVREIQAYYKTGELAQESEFAKFRYQLAQQADREAKGSDQRQASRAIADKAAALDTLGQFFGLTRGVKVSRDSLEGLAVRWTRTNGSRADRTKLANEAQVLVEYLKAEGADMSKAQALAETLAGEVLDGATYRNSELWDEYPELHKLEYTVNKTGAAKAELVRRYGSWGEAVAEARRHGVTLRQAEGVRDGNPAEQYESIVNDVSAAGYVRDGARALWKSAAEQAGVDGALSMESTEWLDVLMNLHDAIKPKMMSRFADVAEYEDARVELAGRMLGDVMNVPEMTDAEAIFEGIMQHNMQVARAAAGNEERAAEVSRELKGIQKGQKALFRERLAQNRRAAGQHAEVQRENANAQAEKQLNDILETQGVDITNLGDLNEKMTVLRESYERAWKEEAKRLKAERQEMLDEAKLEVKRLRSEKNELAWQLRQETRRADTAEYSLIVQENEIAEWEAESERKREAFAEKQAQRNALAIEAAQQQRDEDIAVAKALAEKRVKKAREGREMDKVRKSVQRNAAALNQLVLRPSPGKYVQQSLIVQAAEVAKLANQAVLNDRAVNRLTALQDSINRSMGTDSAPTAMTEDWKKSGVPVLIQTLREDMTAAKEARLAKLREQLAEAEALPESEKAEMLRDRLKARIRETENRTYLPLTLEQMRMLNAITSSTLHVIRTANKTLSLAKAEEVDKIAVTAAGEVQDSKGNHPGGALDGLHNLLTKYNLDMLGAERVFRMIGGYAKDGQMEKLARMLNDGQRRQTEITIEGEKKFANVTGKEHLKEMAEFAGPGAKLVDIGLVDSKGEAVPLTHAQLCSLYMHLQNKDSVEHLMTGGMVLPDAKLYSAGDIEQAYQKGQTVQLGMLKDAQGNPMPDSVLNTVEAALTDYDRAWIEDMKEFFGSYTTNLINETSMQLLGYNRAQVKNYYPIAVDKGVLATQIEGLNLDATIEGRGFLKNRVKSSKPILLEECSSVVQRSLRDTAAYAGLALPIRDVQKVLNSNVETADGLGNLKNKIIKEQWGKGTVDYINDLLTDLQTTQRRRDNGVSRVAARLRGNYAGAVLTLNPGVAIAQAASLPTAGAVLGMDTMAAVVPFVKNLSAKQRAALEAEITQHGDALLEYRKRGSQRGELASIGKDGSLAEKAMDRLPKALTGWINGMDEITVAALWEGSKAYVKNHPAEFSAEAAKAGREEYWKAVNETYQKVIERTQPNYTVMQRAGIQRNPDEFVKAFTMFTTQRFQNYGILADAVMDYKTQSARYKAQQSAENRSEVQRAGKQLNRAVVSQVTQTAVFALMKIGADFLLHRWDREQDENGDVTLESMLKRFTALFTESAAGNFLFGSELYSAVDNAMSGKDYDVVSATNISAVNDLMSDAMKWFAEWRRDTSGMTEAQLAAHEDRLHTRTFNLIEDGMEIAGVPYGNGRKLVDAVQGYWDDIQTVARGGKFSFNALPESATGQYDRLYEAYANGDTGEAQAAMEKLGAMGKESEVYSQLKRRLVQYGPDVLEAAQARNNGNDARREQLTRQIIREMYETMGIDQRAKADAAKREAVIDMVTGAVEQKGDTLLKGDSESVTDALEQALESVRAKDAQEELDKLLRAGKSLSSVKSKITAVCKPEYVAGSDYDRTQLDEMLLALRDADNNPLYTQKTLDGWVSDAEKKSKAQNSDPWADLR